MTSPHLTRYLKAFELAEIAKKELSAAFELGCQAHGHAEFDNTVSTHHLSKLMNKNDN